jgi:ribosome maturation factor RimP
VPAFLFLGPFLFIQSDAMAVKPKQTVEDQARAIVEPILAIEGVELVDLEFTREQHGWVLRLYIDKTGGVGLEDCTQVSHAVETALEVEDPIPHEYHLEVSSPGLNRPLKKPEHFRQVAGKKVRVKTYGPVGEPPRKNFSGLLVDVALDGVTVEVEGSGSFRIPFRDIAKANLEFDFKQ